MDNIFLIIILVETSVTLLLIMAGRVRP